MMWLSDVPADWGTIGVINRVSTDQPKVIRTALAEYSGRKMLRK